MIVVEHPSDDGDKDDGVNNPIGSPGSLSAKLVLKQNPIFGALSAELIDLLVNMSRNRSFAPGDQVFREGDPGDFLLGLISGGIDIRASSSDGQFLNLNRIYPGEVIGEIAFLDGGLRTASGYATEPTVCFVIPRPPFLELMRTRGELAVQLLLLVCKRVRWTSERVADFAFLTPQARLGRHLLHLAADEQEVRISQAELASYLGVSRQVVNGYLREWQQLGAVELKRGRIGIPSSTQLAQLAGLLT